VKIKLKQVRKNLRPNQVGIVQDFVKFLQDYSPIKNNVTIVFTDVRNENITTGKQQEYSITVFSKSRILIDILRTLAHEWVHILQLENGDTQKKDEDSIEDQASAMASYFIREYIKSNPEHETEVYKD